MIDVMLEEELGLEYDLVETVMSSLRTHQVDYCFNKKSFDAILRLAKEQGINLVYKIVNDRFGNLDYVEFIPAKFYKIVNQKKSYIDGTYQYSRDNLPVNWKYDRSKYLEKKKSTIPTCMQKGPKKTIDYLAKEQGKEYLF